MSNFSKLYIAIRSIFKTKGKDREKYLKLLNYAVKLSDHVHWPQKSDY